MAHSEILFVTGTDTGVGKTLVSCLLLALLREDGRGALGLKPFCSGSRRDAFLLRGICDRELAMEDVNPFFFAEAVAPAVAAEKNRRRITLPQAVQHIRGIQTRGETLLIEGAGGLLSPLGHKFNNLDLINALNARVIVVAANKLGTINHTLLTIEALKNAGAQISGVILSDRRRHDASAKTNLKTVQKLLDSIPVVSLPWIGAGDKSLSGLRHPPKNISRSLRAILPPPERR